MTQDNLTVFVNPAAPNAEASYLLARTLKEHLEAQVANTSAYLRGLEGVGSGAFGMTPDSVKANPAYKNARADYVHAHDRLRSFNTWFLAEYGARYREEKRRRDDARRAGIEG